MRFARLPLALALAASPALGQSAATPPTLPLKLAPRATTPAITAADLMTRLYRFADDSMMGRQAGSEGHMKATAYIASQLRALGLVPAGDSGWFQYVPIVSRRFDSTATLSVDGTTLRPSVDFWAINARGTPRSPDGATVVFGGTYGDSSTWISESDVAGKFIVLRASDSASSRPVVPYIRAGTRFSGAAAVAVVERDDALASLHRSRTDSLLALASRAAGPETASPLHLIITAAAARTLLGTSLDSVRAGARGRVVHGTIPLVERPVVTRNVIAILPGSDPKLKGEYVAIGAHSDHIGVRHPAVDHDSLRYVNEFAWQMRGMNTERPALSAEQRAAIPVNVDSLHRVRPARLDSVNNGADDDGSGSVSLLEIAERMVKQHERPRRSILFVWHTAEELGLIGSRWFTDHPTVPRDSIVAQLNIDMIGRGAAWDWKGGGPDFVQLVGSRRLSTELGDLVEQVNAGERPPLRFDYSFDAAGHPENIYCRSDHYMYARYGIPITFFTTGLHEDYHQVTDEPQYIDYPHMARVATLIHDVALRVANLDHRPRVDKPKPDPFGACKQ